MKQEQHVKQADWIIAEVYCVYWSHDSYLAAGEGAQQDFAHTPQLPGRNFLPGYYKLASCPRAQPDDTCM